MLITDKQKKCASLIQSHTDGYRNMFTVSKKSLKLGKNNFFTSQPWFLFFKLDQGLIEKTAFSGLESFFTGGVS